MSASPTLSPIMGTALQQQPDSPPPQQLSKRDKKRSQLHDRLKDMTDAFSANRDTHYRDQLQAIQVDINLITNADPHGGTTLPDSPEVIDEMVKAEVQRMMMKSMGDKVPLRAGRIYADFAKDINDAMEEKDTSLAQHQANFESKMAGIAAQHAYKRKLAETEHDALSTTMRDRLINSVTSKKARLSKDKEALEITNESTYLLHPSQFGIANPASPGGIHGKRATRHRREAEELPNFTTESHKRKRKAQDSDESPAPSRQRLDNGSRTPIWQAEKALQRHLQFDTNLYSIEKLFTEKELSMTYNAAALASYTYMNRPTQSASDVVSPPNGKSDSNSDQDKNGAGGADVDADEAGSPQGGVGMERQYSHATRSTRGNYLQTGLGYDVYPDIQYPGTVENIAKNIPKLPPMISFGSSRSFAVRTDIIANVAGLSAEDAAAELDLIRRARTYNDEHGKGSNLEADLGAKKLLADSAYPKTHRSLLEPYIGGKEYGYISRNYIKDVLHPHKPQHTLVSNARDDAGTADAELSRNSSRGVSVV